MIDKKIALIPSYKPTKTLIDLVELLSKDNIEVVIVDDGSGQEYKEIIDKCKEYAHTISYEINQGKGHALKTGLKYIKENYKEPFIVVTMDCDGQHTIKDAKKIMNEVTPENNILVIGKRLRNNNTPLRSKIGNAITRTIYRYTTGLDIYDTQSGLRAFSNKLTDYLISIEGNRFEYEMNVLLKCAKDKIRMKEVEITTIYIDKNSGSHFSVIKDSFIIYKTIFKFLVSERRK